MSLRNKVPDKTLQTTVNRKLQQKSVGTGRITATVRSGDVTVTGTIKHETERRPVIRCISAIPGIGRVVDQLRLEARKPNM